jgi:HEPN domain-containing protein
VKPETEKWLKLSDEDGAMARAALETALFRPCVYHAQQMIEKVLKASWIEQHAEGYPPKTHKLLPLAEQIGLDPDDQTSEFLDDLAEQYNPTRYGDVMLEYSRERATRYYERALEICKQLRAKLS